MKDEGRAQVGDCVRTRHGDYVEIVSVVSAGLLIEAMVERDIAAYRGTPNFMRDSIAGTCCLHGETSGRDKQRIDRWKHRVKGAA